jgi:DNA-binding NarL/FixJ family response regulator
LPALCATSIKAVSDPALSTLTHTPVERLSPREREVLHMAALGLTNHQIAGQLDVTVHAVKFHLAGIYRKLKVSNRTEAAVVYLRSGALRTPSASSRAESSA